MSLRGALPEEARVGASLSVLKGSGETERLGARYMALEDVLRWSTEEVDELRETSGGI